jgi:hypothetical protein
MISSGNNYPDFSFSRNHLDRLIISLHNRVPKLEFVQQYKWSVESYDNAIFFLETKGFVKKTNGFFVPTCMIISAEEGADLYMFAAQISSQLADSVTAHFHSLKEEYNYTHISKTVPFDSISFFLVSDVLLDNWQIASVESTFLHEKRPSRNGKNYYYAFLENNKHDSDPFDIYGNMVFDDFSVYGNNQRKVIRSKVSQNLASIPLIDSYDSRIFEKFSESFTEPLISVLNINKDYAFEIYNKSGYSKEVNFPEFFIWWYHFIYTQTTNLIAEKGLIVIPSGGNYLYRMM